MKVCSKCKIEKPLSEFYKDKGKRDGLCSSCKECHINDYKEYSKNNKEKIKEYARKYREKNKQKLQEYRNLHKEQKREYDLKNRDKIYKRLRKYYKERRKVDSNYRLRISISGLMNKSLKRNKNGYHWETLVDYKQEDLRNHLERQFKDGMTWENYGKDGWVIDHKIPISIFNITGMKSNGFKKCWDLSNLQPMWGKENNKKSNKLFY